MSREERRAYQRMTKNRDPYALPPNPAVKARQEKLRARRERVAAAGVAGPPSARFWWWTIGGGLVAGVLGFSFAWPAMPLALVVGAVVLVAWIVLAFGLRTLRRRGSPGR